MKMTLRKAICSKHPEHLDVIERLLIEIEPLVKGFHTFRNTTNKGEDIVGYTLHYEENNFNWVNNVKKHLTNL